MSIIRISIDLLSYRTFRVSIVNNKQPRMWLMPVIWVWSKKYVALGIPLLITVSSEAYKEQEDQED